MVKEICNIEKKSNHNVFKNSVKGFDLISSILKGFILIKNKQKKMFYE